MWIPPREPRLMAGRQPAWMTGTPAGGRRAARPVWSTQYKFVLILIFPPEAVNILTDFVPGVLQGS